VWSVSCFFFFFSFRRKGLTVKLLKAAVAHVRRRGGRCVEGYPVDTKAAADVFVWTGLAAAFRRAGFREIARRSAARPIMRYNLSRASRR